MKFRTAFEVDLTVIIPWPLCIVVLWHFAFIGRHEECENRAKRKEAVKQ